MNLMSEQIRELQLALKQMIRERNEDILRRRLAGETYVEIARHWGLSVEWIAGIVSREKRRKGGRS